MVTNNGVDSAILKVKYGNDIRKSELHHLQDLNYNDLILMMQRIFQLKYSTNISLKYRDSDGDWITLANDDDVMFALRHEPSLNMEIFTEELTDLNSSKPASPINSESIVNTRVNINKENLEKLHLLQEQSQIPPQQLEEQQQNTSTISPSSIPLEISKSTPHEYVPQPHQLYSTSITQPMRHASSQQQDQSLYTQQQPQQYNYALQQMPQMPPTSNWNSLYCQYSTNQQNTVKEVSLPSQINNVVTAQHINSPLAPTVNSIVPTINLAAPPNNSVALQNNTIAPSVNSPAPPIGPPPVAANVVGNPFARGATQNFTRPPSNFGQYFQ